MAWLSLFLGNLAFVRFIGLEQFSKSLDFLSFLKKTSLSFVLIALLYALSFPLSSWLVGASLPYLLPIIYGLLGFGVYWLVNFLKKNYDYNLVENPAQLRLDFFYKTLSAGVFFFIFSLHPSFLEGIFLLLLSFSTYILAYILWLGIRNRIKTEIYESPARRYWSYYFSPLLLALFFCSLSLAGAFTL